MRAPRASAFQHAPQRPLVLMRGGCWGSTAIEELRTKLAAAEAERAVTPIPNPPGGRAAR